MAAHFNEDGIQFLYPENWEIQREETETGWTIAVQSPETALLVVSLDAEMPEMEEMALAALDALKEEYKDLEADECSDTVAGQPALGYNVRFFSLDLTNTGWIRSLYSGGGTLLLMWQINDLESPRNEPVLRAICHSLKIEDD